MAVGGDFQKRGVIKQGSLICSGQMEKYLAISFPRFAWECSADASRPDSVCCFGREASRRHYFL
ncbi:Uncharacterized protein dnm_099120 [Desulfonema magnum]|uniref:Uncharacterized protein n=1 Tax=Desulfonema magnum TaxID=45655 RepID=A0A975C0N6_9BACT|nr:Uncharacterized protein dnm_099120 [Desulfonema magnum]